MGRLRSSGTTRAQVTLASGVSRCKTAEEVAQVRGSTCPIRDDRLYPNGIQGSSPWRPTETDTQTEGSPGHNAELLRLALVMAVARSSVVAASRSMASRT